MVGRIQVGAVVGRDIEPLDGPSLAAGQVGVNTNPLSGVRSIRCPFVGHKESGYGTHSGFDGWRQFSTPKSLIYAEAPADDAVPAVAKRDRRGPAVPPVAAVVAFAAGVLITLAATRSSR